MRKRNVWWRQSGGWMLLVLIVGCGGQSPKEAAGLPPREQALMAHDPASVEGALRAEPGGRVVWRAIEAHGGWEAWMEQGAHTYRREPAPLGPGRGRLLPPPRNGAATVPVAKPAQMAAKIGESSPVGPVPFLFAAPEFQLEYLGVEWNSDDELSFEKVRVVAAPGRRTPGGAEESEEHIALFDQTSGLLRRLLTRRSAGWELRRFSDWKRVGELRLAMHAEVYLLKRRFSHRGEIPDWMERLVEGGQR